MKFRIDNLAQHGLIEDKPAHEIPVNAWSSGSNITFRDNQIQKAKGNTKCYITPGCRPQWLLPYDDPADSNYHWIYPGLDDNDKGKIYTVSGSTNVNRTRKNADAAISAIVTGGGNLATVTIASTTYDDGDEVDITGSDSTPLIDGTWTLTKTSDIEFTIDIGAPITVSGTAGTASIDSNYAPSMSASVLNIPWTGGVLNGLVIVNNGVDIPQKWDRTSGTLNGNFEDLANWPANYSARCIRPFRNFLIAMDVTDSGAVGVQRNPYRVMWSDAADPFTEPSTWTATASSRAGDVYLSEGGDYVIDGAQLRGSFIIYKNESTYIMRFVGGNAVMQVDRLFSGHGIIGPRCFAQFGDGMHFVVTKGDVIVHDGTTAKSIADERVRRKIFSEMDTTYFNMCFCAPYYREEEVWFCYTSGGNSFAEKAAIWNYKTGAWSFRELSNCPHIGYGTINTTSGDTWSTVTSNWSTDSSVWATSVFSPAADDLMLIERGAAEGAANDTTALSTFQQVDSGNTFDGVAMGSSAKMEKLDIHPDGEGPYDVKYVRRMYPKIAGGPVQLRVGSSMSEEDTVSWSGYMAYDPATDHKIDVRQTGRYIAFEVGSSGDVHWQMDSLDIEYEITSNGR